MKPILPQIFVDRIGDHYADEICHLNWDRSRPWTLLFAVILSAQCTDERVNKTTAHLFVNFPDLESYVAKPIELLESELKSINFFRNKSKFLKQTAQKLLLDHGGNVPDTMEELTSLSGVARKTANVILWNVFQKNIGFVVDTHVGRISRRVGFTTQKIPEKIEKDLMKQLPQEKWGKLSHQLVQFGRDFCTARKPKCGDCFLNDVCPKRGVS